MTAFPAETVPQPAAKTAFLTKATPAPVLESLGFDNSDFGLVEQRAATGGVTVGSAPGFLSIGCYTDYASPPVLADLSSENFYAYNEPGFCCQWCANHNTKQSYCGVMDGTKCVCGTGLVSTQTNSLVPYLACSSPCLGPGNSDMACGATGRINMYTATVNLSTNVYVSTGTATLLTMDGYSHLGCYSDPYLVYATRLFDQKTISGSVFMDPTYCCGLCLNYNPAYVICAIEVQDVCYCGTKDALASATSVASSLCSNNCLGNNNHLCGGSYVLRAYSATTEASSQPSSLASNTASQTASQTNSGGGTDNTQPATPGKSGLHGGAIAGVVIGALVGVALIAAVAFFLGRRHSSNRAEKLAKQRASAIEAPGDNQFGGPGPYQLETNLSPEAFKTQSQLFYEMPAHPGPEQYHLYQQQQLNQQPLELPLEQPAQQQPELSYQQPYQQHAQQSEYQPEQQLPQQPLQGPPQQPPQQSSQQYQHQ